MTERSWVQTPPPDAPPRVERRRAVRFPCLTECLVRIEGTEVGDWAGMAFNISAKGIALALPFPVPIGAVLLIDQRSPRRGLGPRRARVVRSRLERWVWFYGCSFEERLPDDEVQTWLPPHLPETEE